MFDSFMTDSSANRNDPNSIYAIEARKDFSAKQNAERAANVLDYNLRDSGRQWEQQNSQAQQEAQWRQMLQQQLESQRNNWANQNQQAQFAQQKELLGLKNQGLQGLWGSVQAAAPQYAQPTQSNTLASLMPFLNRMQQPQQMPQNNFLASLLNRGNQNGG